jgi:hypothetical protein
LVEEEEEFNLVLGFFLEKVILVEVPVSDMGDNIMSLLLVEVSLLVMFSCLDVLLLLLLLLALLFEICFI